jgi:hypothetical protein
LYEEEKMNARTRRRRRSHIQNSEIDIIELTEILHDESYELRCSIVDPDSEPDMKSRNREGVTMDPCSLTVHDSDFLINSLRGYSGDWYDLIILSLQDHKSNLIRKNRHTL